MKHILIASLLLVLLAGCSIKKIAYFQDSNEYSGKVENIDTSNSRIIRPFDQIDIRIVTLDPELNNLLNIKSEARDASLMGYLVSNNGFVDLPKLGKIKVAGLSAEQAEDSIAAIASNLVKSPFVSVQIISFRIYVLGEVNNPGAIALPHHSPTLIDALGLAGDISLFGNRQMVKVIREVSNNSIPIVFELDMTSVKVYEQLGFNLRPGDVVYVEPLKRKALSAVAPTLGLIFSFLSFITTLLTLYIRANL